MENLTTTQQFDQLLAENPRTIVKFYTNWCPDCHRIKTAYAEYTDAKAGPVKFAEINADEVPAVAQRYDVRGIPSFLVFQDGQLIDRLYSRDAKSVKQVLDFADKAIQELTGGTVQESRVGQES